MYACSGTQPCQGGSESKGAQLRVLVLLLSVRGSFMSHLVVEKGLGYQEGP